MRFLAVAALSLAMTTAYGQQGQSGSSQGSKSSTGSEYQKDKTGTQSQQDRTGTQSQPGTKSSTQQGSKSSTQSGQGMGMGTAEERVKSEVSWMKSEFNLDQNQEKKLHDALLKYDKPHDATSGQGVSSADVAKNKEAKEKEIKAIIGDQNFEIYKQKKAEKKSGTSGQGTVDPSSRDRSTTSPSTSPSSTSPSSTSPSSTSPSSTSPSSTTPSSTSPSTTPTP